MPTTEDEVTNKSIPLALQSLFYKVMRDSHFNLKIQLLTGAASVPDIIIVCCCW